MTAQSFNGLLKQLNECSLAHDTLRVIGCETCPVQSECLHIWDKFCDTFPERPRYKHYCYRTSLELEKLRQTV